MNLKNRPPVFVPREFQREMEKLSKAALMDMVWDYAQQVSGDFNSPEATMRAFRIRREIVLMHREQERSR